MACRLSRAGLGRIAFLLTAAVVLSGCGGGAGSGQARPARTWPPRDRWLLPLVPPAAAELPRPPPEAPPATNGPPPDSLLPPAAHGTDVSFPQCTAGRPASGAAFTAVGVNGGRDFTLNPCFPRLWAQRQGPGFIYLNSGYSPDNASRVTAGCRQRAKAVFKEKAHRLAYAIGCSTAEDTLDALHQFGIAPAVMWWVDVENANSWDDHRLTLNRAALRGEIDRLAATGLPTGVYSTFRDWRTIAGDWTYAGIAGDWVAGKSPQDACSGVGFSGAPVWLAQELATWPGSGWDSDYAC